MDPRLHQAFFSAVRSGDVEAVRAVVDGSDHSIFLSGVQAEGGETALYMAAEGNMEELFCYLLPLYTLETASIRSRLDLDAFHVAAKCGRTGNVLALFLSITVDNFFLKKQLIINRS
jgi:hypothetical protein